MWIIEHKFESIADDRGCRSHWTSTFHLSESSKTTTCRVQSLTRLVEARWLRIHAGTCGHIRKNIYHILQVILIYPKSIHPTICVLWTTSTLFHLYVIINVRSLGGENGSIKYAYVCTCAHCNNLSITEYLAFETPFYSRKITNLKITRILKPKNIRLILLLLSEMFYQKKNSSMP